MEMSGPKIALEPRPEFGLHSEFEAKISFIVEKQIAAVSCGGYLVMSGTKLASHDSATLLQGLPRLLSGQAYEGVPNRERHEWPDASGSRLVTALPCCACLASLG